jgi:hypothetical protein
VIFGAKLWSRAAGDPGSPPAAEVPWPTKPTTRKTKEIVITADGRDKGKRFFVTEMFAWDWCMWTTRAALAVSRSGGNVPAGILQQGMAGIVSFGLQALTACQWEDAKPLMEEIFATVQQRPDNRPGKHLVTINLRAEDIAEPATIYRLFEEVVSLNLGFSLAEAGPKFVAALMAMIAPSPLPDPSISPQSSEP